MISSCFSKSDVDTKLNPEQKRVSSSAKTAVKEIFDEENIPSLLELPEKSDFDSLFHNLSRKLGSENDELIDDLEKKYCKSNKSCNFNKIKFIITQQNL